MTATSGLPWYYHSPIWQRYRAGRLMYVGARAEGISALAAAAIATFEALRPSPRIKIKMHRTAHGKPPAYLTKDAALPAATSAISARQIGQHSAQAPVKS